MKILGKINVKFYMSLSVLNYIHVPLSNIDMSLFCIDMNIEAHFYRYINISDINDSSSVFLSVCRETKSEPYVFVHVYILT